MSVTLEFHKLISKSVSFGKKTASCNGAFGGASNEIIGKNEQQWYAYDNTNVCIRGNNSGLGNSLKLGLLNVFKCNKRSNPKNGNRGNLFCPKFL